MTAGFDPPPPPGGIPAPDDPPVPSAPPPPPDPLGQPGPAPIPPTPAPMVAAEPAPASPFEAAPGQPGWVPPAAAPPRKGRFRLRWLVLGAIAVVAAVLGYQYWDQQQNYKAGHEAYLAADCAAAIVPLRKAADGSGDTATQALAELQECQALLAGSDLVAGGSPSDGLLAYSEFLVKYGDGPLGDAALDRGRGAIVDAEPEDVASKDVCEALGPLEEQGFLAPADEALPPLLYACGQTFEASAAYADAIAVLGRFLTSYPDHALTDPVKEAFARVTVADAKAAGAGSLPDPNHVGPSEAGGDLATVVIQNSSPESMGIVFSGPDTRVEKLEACPTCETYPDTGPDECPDAGPVGTYVVEPGSYEVVVTATSTSNVTPFHGTWTLSAGEEYSSCFYVVTH